MKNRNLRTKKVSKHWPQVVSSIRQ